LAFWSFRFISQSGEWVSWLRLSVFYSSPAKWRIIS
jgi:hypothetical protein